jgi:YD repeat-containing protein
MGQADTTRYVYDAFGSLVSVALPNGTLIEYLLDGNGLRIGRKFNGAITNKWIYSNNLRIVAETDSTNRVVSRFVYTTSEPARHSSSSGGSGGFFCRTGGTVPGPTHCPQPCLREVSRTQIARHRPEERSQIPPKSSKNARLAWPILLPIWAKYGIPCVQHPPIRTTTESSYYGLVRIAILLI